jgi:putative DNA primase/helicase
MNDPIEQFRNAMASAGLVAPDDIHGDGRLHRFSPTGKARDDAGWYVLHLDGVAAGVFGDWRAMFQSNWCAKADNEMTDAERQAIRARVRQAQAERDRETDRRRAQAAERANTMWAAAIPAATHGYLLRKQVKACGLRIGQWKKVDPETGELLTLNNVLYIPMRDSTGKLQSLQGITADSEKLFFPGGRVKGCYHSIGRPGARLFIAEGYATAATVYEATGDAVAVAFNAGNLESVARALRAKYPDLPMVIAADDDWKTTDPRTGQPMNPGVLAARAAASAVRALVAVPDFSGIADRPDNATDYNDLARLAGAVKIGGAA